MSELVPQSAEHLLRRMLTDLARGREIFGLPGRSIWRARETFALSVTLPGGAGAATPLGPAAGPHTQLAPNIVAAWLAGSRVIELKTVQVRDQLEIPRPCIDAPGVGWNVEWSQELRLADSVRQYAIAWLLVHVLAARGVAGPDLLPGVVFDSSVGYDLEGIRSAKVAAFLDTLADATSELAAIRASLPAELREVADVAVPERISDTVTVSTFHGCPPEEIERIVEHLVSRHHLHVVVKLNPTLLGFETVDGLLRGTMGYGDVTLDPAAFAHDLGWTDALAMLERLGRFAWARGRTLGVKFTNTLLVRNTRGRLPGAEAYLSGPPLHVLAVTLAHRFVEATAGRFPVSFSAGLDADNFADTVACGFAPATTCTDLLRPTGYRRLPRYLKSLEAAMEACGADTVNAFILARAGLPPGTDPGAGARANLAAYAVRVPGETRYHRPAQPDVPVARPALPTFDCESCNNCVVVCPNGAFFAVPSPTDELARGRLTRDRQYVLFEDACNGCGNCDTHCPQAGGPQNLKPRFGRGHTGLRAPGADPAMLRALEVFAREHGVPLA